MPDLKLENTKLRQLVDQFSRGELSVPEFQRRDDAWRPNKAAKLFDSLYRKYPISCLVAWQTGSKVEARKRPKPGSAPLRWILDGQQRWRTLQKTMDGDLDVMFNVNEQKFSRDSATTKHDGWIRVADLWSIDTYRDLRNTTTRTQEERLDRVRQILDYEVPIITMMDHDFGDAVESFRRLNTLGVRLSTAEIESAHMAEKHAGFIRNDFIPFLDYLRRNGFDRLSSTHLFRACEFIARPDARDRTLLHKMDRQEVQTAWQRTKRATHTALGLLQNEFGLHDMRLLWSGNLLVPVICLCDRPVTDRRDKEVAGWIALAALNHRYSKASDNAVDQDLRACRANDPIAALLANIRGKRMSMLSGEWDFNSTIADRSALFATYIACHQLNAVDLITHGKIDTKVDRHHVFPRALFRDRQDADAIANIAFTTGDANKAIGDTHPSVYLAKIEPKVLRSQAIPLDHSLWDVDRSSDFWQKRRELLSEAFNEYVRQALPNRKKL